MIIAEGYPAPHELLDVIQYQGKNCFTEAYGCQRQHLSFTPVCNCYGGQGCLNPSHGNKGFAQSAVEESETDGTDSNYTNVSDDGHEGGPNFGLFG